MVRAQDSSPRDKSDDRHTSTKKQKNERKGSGPGNPKPTKPAQRSFRPPESEHAKAHKDIGQTLIDRQKRLNQCSRCGDPNKFWRKCPAAPPVVASARLNRKQTVHEAGHLHGASFPNASRIEAPPPAVKQVEAEIRGSAPQILEVDTDASD